MSAPVPPDRVLARRYRLITPLGSGGMGTVWLALDELLDRQVAVKEVSPSPDVTEEERVILRERTLREARTAARLRHPNVVTIYDVVEDGDRPWIVMELGPARSLRDVVQQDGPLAPQQAARIGLQVLAALRAAHAIGVMHRDVKPGNVLIDADGRAVLADFGIARAQDSPALTASGVVVGSPSYIAPERARGERGGPESDLWSLGATLYCAVEGRPPWDRPGALATLMALAMEDPDPPRRAGPLWPVIIGLLRRDPELRPDPGAVEGMLRQIAETDTATRVPPVPAAAGPASPAGDNLDESSTPERLNRAERTLAFHPLASGSVPPLPAAESSPSPEADGAPAAVPGEPAPDPVSPAGSLRDHTQPVREHHHETEPLGGLKTGSEADLPSAPERQHRHDALPRRLTWIVTALAAMLVVAGGIVFGLRIEGQGTGLAPTRTAHSSRGAGASPGAPARTTRPPASSSPAASAGTSRPGGSAARPTSGGSAAGGSASSPDTGQAEAAPAGFHPYTDPTGFSIAVPDGWTVSHEGNYVYLRDPARGRFLLIDQSGHPRPNPLADWRQQEANRIGTYPGYHRIRLEAVSYPQAEKAADWEFTYNSQSGPVHVLNRNVLANSRHAYALYWSTPAGEWNESFRLFRVFARTFHPAPA